ncbi:MAG: hypothetical protein ACRD07_23275, partial [Acidimicrobiales bacterium]
LAQRLGLRVSLAHTPGGGVTALVTLPQHVVNERRLPAPEVPAPAFAGAALAGAVGSADPPWGVQFHDGGGASLGPQTATAMAAPVAAAIAAPVAQPGAPFGAPVFEPAAPFWQPAPPFAAPDPAPVTAPSPMTADGLVRRVPGASLAPSLRKTSGGDGAAPIAAGGTTPADWRPGEQAGSMLSRFQANQRAGRAAAMTAAPIDLETDPAGDGQ